MWEDLAALTPPVTVAVVFSVLLYKMLRGELAGRKRDTERRNDQ
jgi:hypothetical protein